VLQHLQQTRYFRALKKWDSAHYPVCALHFSATSVGGFKMQRAARPRPHQALHFSVRKHKSNTYTYSTRSNKHQKMNNKMST
jgi:hypothetical protein